MWRSSHVTRRLGGGYVLKVASIVTRGTEVSMPNKVKKSKPAAAASEEAASEAESAAPPAAPPAPEPELAELPVSRTRKKKLQAAGQSVAENSAATTGEEQQPQRCDGPRSKKRRRPANEQETETEAPADDEAAVDGELELVEEELVEEGGGAASGVEQYEEQPQTAENDLHEYGFEDENEDEEDQTMGCALC